MSYQAVLLARADGRRASTEGAADSRAIGALHAGASIAVVHELFAIPVFHTVEVAISRGFITKPEGACCQANRSTLARVALVGVGLAGFEVDTVVLTTLNHGVDRVDDGLNGDRSAFVAISTDGGIIESSVW